MYTVINRDPIRKFTESIRILLMKWKNCGYIDSNVQNIQKIIAVMEFFREHMDFPRFIK